MTQLALTITKICNTLKRYSGPISMDELNSICSSLQIKGHLAILNQPYLDRIIVGQKTVESRFTKSRIPPFGRVNGGDVLFLKQSAGPIIGIAIVSKTEFLGPLSATDVLKVMNRYQKELTLENEFRQLKKDSKYVSLMHIAKVSKTLPLYVTKNDRRSWIILNENFFSPDAPKQLMLFSENSSNCNHGLHTYHKSHNLNAMGHRICKYCGEDSIDWDRIHRLDFRDVGYTVSQLNTDSFRHYWWNITIDERAVNHALRKGIQQLRKAAFVRIKKSVGEVHEMPDGRMRPYRDGFQTPFTGNSIYYAQHALACCCRKCMNYWHGIPSGRDLTIDEINYFTKLVMYYIIQRIPNLRELGVKIPVKSVVKVRKNYQPES